MGCGLGRLCAEMARHDRKVTGIDVSPVMIERARAGCHSAGVDFVEGDFLTFVFGDSRFDCIVTAAALHHMPLETSVAQMISLLKPGGRLIVHDMRRDEGLVDMLRAYVTLAHQVLVRFLRTGRLRAPLHVRAAWIRHGKDEHYLSFAEVEQIARDLLPGARVYYHSMWRYTIAWDKP